MTCKTFDEEMEDYQLLGQKNNIEITPNKNSQLPGDAKPIEKIEWFRLDMVAILILRLRKKQLNYMATIISDYYFLFFAVAGHHCSQRNQNSNNLKK